MRGPLIDLHDPAALVDQDRFLGVLFDPLLEYFEILAGSDPGAALTDIDALCP
jgi:hypothetical protein